MNTDTKRCPYCAEEINRDAIKCRHCGEILDPEIKAARMGRNQPTMQREKKWEPGIAAVLSLVIPGAGQMYKQQIGGGIAWLICTVLGYCLFIIPGLILHLICIVTAASGDPYK